MRSGWLWPALLVGTGGFLGSVFRYALSGLVHRLAPFAAFPYGTLAVNVTGCLAIGVLCGLTESRQIVGPDLRLFLLLGLLGGFTTFSTFGYETMALLRDSEQLRAATNVLMHVFAGLSAVWLGYSLSRMW